MIFAHILLACDNYIYFRPFFRILHKSVEISTHKNYYVQAFDINCFFNTLYDNVAYLQE